MRERIKSDCVNYYALPNTTVFVIMKLLRLHSWLVIPLLLPEVKCSYFTSPHGDTVDHDIWTLVQEE